MEQIEFQYFTRYHKYLVKGDYHSGVFWIRSSSDLVGRIDWIGSSCKLIKFKNKCEGELENVYRCFWTDMRFKINGTLHGKLIHKHPITYFDNDIPVKNKETGKTEYHQQNDRRSWHSYQREDGVVEFYFHKEYVPRKNVLVLDAGSYFNGDKACYENYPQRLVQFLGTENKLVKVKILNNNELRMVIHQALKPLE